jgi:putative transposase
VALQIQHGSAVTQLTGLLGESEPNAAELKRLLEDWAYQRGVQLDFIRPGRPVENAYIESFNGKRRDKGLNVHQFASIADAQHMIKSWRRDDNEQRPHSSLGDLTPAEFVAKHQDQPTKTPPDFQLRPVHKRDQGQSVFS